eukprot:8536946-Pyramimonas_sp.AAC.1
MDDDDGVGFGDAAAPVAADGAKAEDEEDASGSSSSPDKVSVSSLDLLKGLPNELPSDAFWPKARGSRGSAYPRATRTKKLVLCTGPGSWAHGPRRAC